MNKRTKLAFVLLFFLILAMGVFAIPTGPSVTVRGNSTKSPTTGAIANGTGNSTDNPFQAGGFVYTITLSAETQNARWKAYVGNVTGTLVLDDADGYSIYDWSLTSSVSGEVYATRTSGTVDWANVNCSTLTNISNEEITMNHTNNPSDNISATFPTQDNQGFFVGAVQIYANTCYTTNTFLNDAAPGGGDQWEEILLHDGTNQVYAVVIDDDQTAFATGKTYDFQLIVPERGYDGWSSSTAYYFYVELS